MWGQGVYGAQILVLVHKFTFKVVLGVIFFHKLSLLLNIQIEESDSFDPQFLKLVLHLFLSTLSAPHRSFIPWSRHSIAKTDVFAIEILNA